MRMIVLSLLAVVAQATAATSVNVSGIWKYEKPGVVANGTVFTVLDASQSCTQIARAKIFGLTKWGVNECAWALEGEALRISIVKSASQPEAAGKTATFTVLSADQTQLLLFNGKEEQKWTRVESLPAEYEQALQESRRSGAQQGIPADGSRPAGEPRR